MIERAQSEIPFVSPDLGPLQRIDAHDLEKALHALSRYRSVLIHGSPDCPVGTDILEEDETLIATYGDEHVSVIVVEDDYVILAMGHRHGTEHLVVDGDLFEALGIVGASPDPRITVLRAIDFAITTFERSHEEGIEPPMLPDDIQFASDLASALGRPAAVHIAKTVGADAENPIVAGTCDGAAGGDAADAFSRLPFTCIRIEGGQFGHEMTIDRWDRTVQATPMDAVARMRIIAEARAKGMLT